MRASARYAPFELPSLGARHALAWRLPLPCRVRTLRSADDRTVMRSPRSRASWKTGQASKPRSSWNQRRVSTPSSRRRSSTRRRAVTTCRVSVCTDLWLRYFLICDRSVRAHHCGPRMPTGTLSSATATIVMALQSPSAPSPGADTAEVVGLRLVGQTDRSVSTAQNVAPNIDVVSRR
jgi:hypothetical protein